MIAAITISLGWWMIPTLITIWLLLWAHYEERQIRSSLLAGGCYIIVLIPVLLVWCIYLAARLVLR